MTKVWDKDNEFRVLDVMHLDELSSGAKRSKFGPMSFLEVAINHKVGPRNGGHDCSRLWMLVCGTPAPAEQSIIFIQVP
jgi:hypothetical protein